MDDPIVFTEELQEEIRKIRDAKTEKTVDEMDTDLVRECVDCMLEGDSDGVLSQEEIHARVDSIPFADEKPFK